MSSQTRTALFPQIGFFLSFLSGFSALLSQTLWLRGFGLAFGGTTASSSLTLAVFMGGLALGSRLAGRFHPRNSWHAYAICEGGVALSAALAYGLLMSLPSWLSPIPQAHADTLVKALLCALITLPCACFSGLSLPFLLEAMEREGLPLKSSFAPIYFFNTLGAASGALASVFFLLPRLGMDGAQACAVGISLALAVTAWSLSKSRANSSTQTAEPAPALPSARRRFAFAAGLSGAAALLLEMLWMRVLTLVLGSSAYAFSAMLCAVLLGIAFGGGLFSLFQKRMPASIRWLSLSSSALAFLSFLSAMALGRLPGAYFDFMRNHAPSFPLYQGYGFALALLALLPATLMQGFQFPLLMEMARGQGARRDSSALYSMNGLGAVLGALGAGFLIIPALGLRPAFGLAAALYACMAALSWETAQLWKRGALGALTLALCLEVGAFYRPWDPLILSSGVYQSGMTYAPQLPASMNFQEAMSRGNHLVFYEEGSEAVVAVRDSSEDGERSLVINGKVDASLKGDVLTQTLLAHLPLFLLPSAKSALLIGWGSGCSAGSALLHPLESLDCDEIEPAVFKTAAFFSAVNSSSWKDPRLHLRLVDARQDLLRRKALYDVIISEPSNPWISGVSNLYTGEFYKIARKRLKPGGLYCQWFHYYNMSLDDIRLQARTFCAAFSNASLWFVPVGDGQSGLSGDIILIGADAAPRRFSDEALLYARDAVRDLAQGAGLTATASSISDWLSSLRLLNDADLRAFAGPGPLNEDRFPRLEFSAPRSLYRSGTDQSLSSVALFRAMEAACQSLPERADGLKLLGVFYSRQNLFYLATRVLESAGKLDAAAELALGRCYLYTSRPMPAEAHLRRAFASNHEAYVSFLKEGGAYIQAGRPELGLGVFEMAVKTFSGDGDAFFGKGLCLKQLGRRDEAVDAFRESLRLKPSLELSKQALRNLGALQ